MVAGTLDKIQALRQSAFLSAIPSEHLSTLVALMYERRFPSDEVVFRQGKEGDALYLIASGKVKVFLTNEEGAEVVLAHLSPGDCFGEMALLTGEPRAASVMAVEDSLLLVLEKNVFDRLLNEIPDLARFCIKLLSQRLRQANVRVAQEANREIALKEFLQEQQEQEPAQVVGTSQVAKELKAQAERAASNQDPVLILGPPGTEQRLLARYIHEKSPRSQELFLVVDCVAIPLVVEGASYRDGEAPFILEVSQESALFGHVRGSFSFAKTSRTGYLEVAQGGTLLLENLDKLASSVQAKLMDYVQRGVFQRLGSELAIPTNVKLILASTQPKALHPPLVSVLNQQTILLPPLQERPRDIPTWIGFLIDKYSRRLDKKVIGLTPEAMNMMLSYHWPQNIEELESVVQRGVRLAQGPILTPEELFIGFAPWEPKGKINLLKAASIRSILASRAFPKALQFFGVALLAVVLASAFLGPPELGRNLALAIVWGWWWPLLIITIPVVGRIFCGTLCPAAALGQWVQERWSKGLKVPQFMRQFGPYIAALGFAFIIWAEQVTAMRSNPVPTGFLLLAITTGAVISSVLFQRAAWCAFLCPMGRMIGAYATLAGVEVRTNKNVCTAECRTHACYLGTEKTPGCPMYVGPFSLSSNEPCVLCARCVKNCENRAVRFHLRLPLQELWNLPHHSLAMAFLVPFLLGTVIAKAAGDSGFHKVLASGGGNESLFFTLLLLTAILFSFGAIGIAAFLTRVSQKVPMERALAWFSYSMLPVAFGGELAYQLEHLLRDGGQILYALGAPLGDQPWSGYYLQTSTHTIQAFQILAVMMGGLASWYAWRRLFPKVLPASDEITLWAQRSLGLVFTLSYLALFWWLKG